MGATRNTENTTRNANANANMITSKTFRHQFEDSATLCDNSRAETCKR